MENANNSPENLQTEANLPEHLRIVERPRTIGLGTALGGILGLATTIFTFRNRTADSRNNALRDSGILDVGAEDTLDAMNEMYQRARSMVGKKDAVDKVMTETRDDAARFARNISNSGMWKLALKERLFDFSGKTNPSTLKGTLKRGADYLDPLGENKKNGLIPLGIRTIATAIGATAGFLKWGAETGADAAKIVLVDGTSKAGIKKVDARTQKKLERFHDKFESKLLNAVGESIRNGEALDEDGKKIAPVKVEFKEHAKNGMIALGTGAVVMGATMLVTKFIEKRRAQKQAEKYADQIEQGRQLQREIAMMQPQTQMSLGQ